MAYPWICAKCGHEFGWGVKPYIPCPVCGNTESVRAAYELPTPNPPPPKTFQEAAYLAAKETADLVIMKQMDYGPRNITDFGEYGILVRLNDKLQRLISLFKQDKEPENETVDDTWDDVGGYALVRKMLRRGWFTLPMKKQINLDAYQVLRDTQLFEPPDPEDAMYG